MSVIIATPQQIQEYHQSEALGQSKLKRLLKDLASFNKEEDSSAEHFLIGSAVDCKLTSTEEDFQKQYYISEVEKKPSDAVIEILGIVYEDLMQDYAEHLEVVTTQESEDVTPFHQFVGGLDNHEVYILDACKQTGWNKAWKDETKYKNIVDGSSEYFSDLCKAFGKTVISKTQNETITSIVSTLTNNPRTSRFFNREAFEQAPQVTVYYQLPIYFEYRGVKCKALLDMVCVMTDENGKIISVSGVDLKTMSGNTYNFIHSVRGRRYDIQAAWYTLALCKHFNLSEDSSAMQPFMFAVESSTGPGKPLTFEVLPSLLEMGKRGRKAISLVDTNLFTEGAENVILQPEILGYEQLLDMYLYHSEFGFIEEREIQEAGLNPIKLSWDGISS